MTTLKRGDLGQEIDLSVFVEFECCGVIGHECYCNFVDVSARAIIVWITVEYDAASGFMRGQGKRPESYECAALVPKIRLNIDKVLANWIGRVKRGYPVPIRNCSLKLYLKGEII